MTTEARLIQYYPEFSLSTVDKIGEIAEWQQTFENYNDFFQAVGFDEVKVHEFSGNSAQILDLKPNDYDSSEALIYHLPMANPLDPNMIYQAATIAAANPNMRVIAMGNPSNDEFVDLDKQQLTVVTNGDFRPLVDPLLNYLDLEKIYSAKHVGYSAGADTAATAIAHGDQEATGAVIIEPASVKKRSLARLAIAFGLTNLHLNEYVKSVGLDTFDQARKETPGLVNYAQGLKRPVNIAIARALAKGGFQDRLTVSLEAQPALDKVNIIWGSKSELAKDGIMQTIVAGLKIDNGSWRINPVRLERQYHALANDVHLQAALVVEGLAA